ncbi:hypothetical protein BASA81_005910 [Batrachochytrium salamandrivorans]|nr:hypothetical protein BASA81_005910 [Batrachochytrium salamandrivorans]
MACSRGDTPEHYHGVVGELLSAPDFANKVSPGGRYHLVGEINAMNFTIDTEHRIYMVITACDYSERLVFQMINELVLSFKREFNTVSLTCGSGSLDGKAKRLFTALRDDYDDPSKKDKLAGVTMQVEGIKLTMGKSLDTMLQNIDRATDIEESSKRLQDQASKFEVQATTMKRRELCRKYQTTAAILCFVAIVVTIIIVSLFGVPVITPAPPATFAPFSPRPTFVPTLAPTLAPSPAPTPAV